jgi:polysaccharide biosynthesis/export protein
MIRNDLPSKKHSRFLIFAFCFGVTVVGWGQADPAQVNSQANSQSDTAQAQTAVPAQAPERAPMISIGAGDQLDVEVFDTPELSASVRVSQTGEINITVLGNIQVAGLTPNQAARKIEAELKSRGILIDPHVTVAIAEYASQGATLTGEVHAPGVYPTLGRRRLLDMIALAGGVTVTAGKVVTLSIVTIHSTPTI